MERGTEPGGTDIGERVAVLEARAERIMDRQMVTQRIAKDCLERLTFLTGRMVGESAPTGR